jgi:cyclopropane-fatty-acyl-phospholipid synthase
MSDPLRVRVIDCHTGGQPSRVVMEGGPDLGPGPLAQRRARLWAEHAAWCRAVTGEPRGSEALMGALVLPPFRPDCALGLIFFNAVGTMGMCGQGTLGVLEALRHLGRIKPGGLRIDTPVGVVATELREDGSAVLVNVAARRFRRQVALEVPGLGRVHGDVAWGGNWFFQVEDHDLELAPGNLERLLDIGCGWGALARHAARYHGVEVVGITLSKAQQQFAQEACRDLPVTIRLQDYRDLPAQVFDRVASIGMFEHVGHKNYTAFLDIVGSHLADEGLFLLHIIGNDRPGPVADSWLRKYIFPNGEIPSPTGIARALAGRFVLEDWHNFGSHYDPTLMAWHRNFTEHWSTLRNRFDQRFFRMWSYYLLSCAGAFRARSPQLWQIVLSRHGLTGGYRGRDPLLPQS